MIEAKQQFVSLLSANERIVKFVGKKYFNDPLDREDFFQDVALSAWSTFPKYRHECQFSTWLYRISVHKAMEKIKRVSSKLRIVCLDNILFEVVTDSGQHSENKIDYQHYIGCLNDLELKLVLMYAEGYSYDEMAIVFDTSPGVLRNRMVRIKNRLRKIV